MDNRVRIKIRVQQERDNKKLSLFSRTWISNESYGPYCEDMCSSKFYFTEGEQNSGAYILGE
jgi:hypothetical protein